MQLLTLPEAGDVHALSLTADGGELAAVAAAGRGVKRFHRLDTATGCELPGRREVSLAEGRRDGALPLLAPGGRLIAYQSRFDGFWLSCRSPEEGRGPVGTGVPLAFSPDGLWLAGWGEDRGRRLCTWATDPGGAVNAELFADWDAVLPLFHTPHAAAFSPDGRAVAALTSSDRGSWQVLRWNPGTGQRLPSLAMPLAGAGFAHLLYAPDGRRLAVAGASVWITEAEEPAERYRLGDAPVAALAFTPDGRRLVGVTAGGEAVVWDCEAGGEVARYDWKRLAGESLHAVAVAADGLTAFAGGTAGQVVRWDLEA